MKTRIRIAVPLLLLAGIAAWLVLRGPAPGAGALAASGTVEGTEADLGFQVPGRLEEIAVVEGDVVSGGQELAWLDRGEMDAAVAAATAQLQMAEARLADVRRGPRLEEIRQAESVLDAARARALEAAREEERTRRLHEGGAVSRQALERAETVLEVARSEVRRASESLDLIRQGARAETIAAHQAAVAQARAQLAQAEAVRAHAVIRAPFPGRITVRHRQAGEVVGPGAPVLTLLDPMDRWVRIYVREDAIGRVRIGMAARIVSDTWPDQEYAGSVTFIGSEAEFTPRNVQTAEERTKLVYPVKVRITSDPDFHLKPGIPADVTLVEGG